MGERDFHCGALRCPRSVRDTRAVENRPTMAAEDETIIRFTVFPAMLSGFFSILVILLCLGIGKNFRLYSCRVVMFISASNLGLCISLMFSPQGEDWLSND